MVGRATGLPARASGVPATQYAGDADLINEMSDLADIDGSPADAEVFAPEAACTVRILTPKTTLTI